MYRVQSTYPLRHNSVVPATAQRVGTNETRSLVDVVGGATIHPPDISFANATYRRVRRSQLLVRFDRQTQVPARHAD